MKNLKKLALGLALACAGASAFAADEPFNATITLLSPITITEGQSLSFVPTLAGQNVNVVTAPADTRAAVFSATGYPNAAVVGSVVESSIEMSTGTGVATSQRITVDTFTKGGDMSATGAATFSPSGSLNALRIGGTAHVQAEDIPGPYVGTATFRLVYL